MLLPYIGEKTQKTSLNIPPDVKTYVEPFGGMFGMYFSLDQIPRRIIYNDSNYLNYNLFYWISKKYKTFKKRINTLESNNEYLFYEYKSDIYKIVNKKLNFEIAVKYAYVLSHANTVLTRNSSFIRGKFFDGFREKFNNEDFIKKIKKIKLFCLDYKSIIKKYDNKNTLFYLDPQKFTEHKILSEILYNIKGRFVLNCPDIPELENYYPTEKYTWQHNKKTGEIIIRNF